MTKDIEKSFKSQSRLTLVAVAAPAQEIFKLVRDGAARAVNNPTSGIAVTMIAQFKLTTLNYIESKARNAVPGPAAADSPVSALLKKNGPAPYHLCYAVAAQNAAAARKILAEKGFALLLRDAPAPALQGRNVAFYYSKDLGLTEILWL